MSQPRHATRIQSSSATSWREWRSKALQLLGRFTRIEIVVLSVAACSIALGVTSFSPESPPASPDAPQQLEQLAERHSMPLELNLGDAVDGAADTLNREPVSGEIAATEETVATEQAAPVQTATAASVISDSKTRPANLEERTRTYTLRKGDNLSSIFQSVGLGASDVYRITRSGDEGKALTRMFPGETLDFVFAADQSLKQIVRKKSELESIVFKPAGDSFKTESVTRQPEVRQVHRSATVTHSLSLAANRAGLSDTLTMNMANIFGGVIDFVYDVREGDKFTVVYEELYLDGKKVDNGDIIAAQYVNRGKTFNAFRYAHNSGEIGYYNEEGESMRKAFLRAPLDFTRVSSGFNLRRLHPITKKVKPHRGIDYAAPTGTPVFSVGEGRVIASGYSNANGKYVFVKHGEAYTTKYLHLSRRNVKKGQRVKQGQIIGKVGCTGLCTGPHLHYEFLVNGVHRNPRTVVSKLPKAKRLAKAELPAFTRATADAQTILQRYSAQFEIAANTTGR